MPRFFMNKISLPWPPAILNPNRRSHWAPKAKAKKKYRFECGIIAQSIKGGTHLKITFNTPDKRRRDLDNMIAAFKAGQDGLADAWGIDDRFFVITYKRGDPVKYGRIDIEVLNWLI